MLIQTRLFVFLYYALFSTGVSLHVHSANAFFWWFTFLNAFHSKFSKKKTLEAIFCSLEKQQIELVSMKRAWHINIETLLAYWNYSKIKASKEHNGCRLRSHVRLLDAIVHHTCYNCDIKCEHIFSAVAYNRIEQFYHKSCLTWQSYSFRLHRFMWKVIASVVLSELSMR